MAQIYASFLIRCWRSGDHEQRLEIEHIQSGERALVAAPGAALEWMAARTDAASARPLLARPPDDGAALPSEEWRPRGDDRLYERD